MIKLLSNRILARRRPLAAVIALVIAAPALAQSSPDVDSRLHKLEAEVAALQRAVFPGGDPRFFPQMQPNQTGATVPGTPATSPSTDMLARMDALEGQVARLTAQVEEDQNKLTKMDARLTALEAAAKPAASPEPEAGSSTQSNLAAMNGTAPPPAAKPAAGLTPSPAPSPAPAPKVTKGTPPKPAAADPSAKRVAAVRAIPKPKTSDPGEDEYSYGFRLFDAKFYPEAEQQLKLFLKKYPKHKRTSFARNLLGRAYLAEGNPREAAGWFLQNYKTEPKGDRAPDSLLNLADAMEQMGDTQRACVALDQFKHDYSAEASGRLKGDYDALRVKVKCN